MSGTLPQCRGKKKRYATEESAKRARMNLWGADPTLILEDTHVYECPYCKDGNGKPFWHVGHIPEWMKKSGLDG